MKSILIIILASISLIVNAQYAQTERRNVEDFSELRVFGNIKATLIKSDSCYIILSADSVDISEVTTSVEKGKLNISNSVLNENNEIIVNIYYKSLDYILVDGGANLKIEDVFKAEKLEIDVRNASILRAKFELNELVMDAGLETDCILSGSVNTADIAGRASCKIRAENMEVKDMDISLTMASEAKVKVSGKLNAKSNIDSKLIYLGTPEKISQKANLGGTISKG